MPGKVEWQLPSAPKRPVVPVRPKVPPKTAEEVLVRVGTPEGATPVVSNRLAEALTDLPELDAAATAAALREARAKAAREQPWWVWASLVDSVRNSRETMRRLSAWWQYWRTTSSFRVLLAFVAIYALLAFMRKPSDVIVERSLWTQEAEYLEGFLKSYCTAGGAVLAVRPHGGSELFPRGVVLQGEMLSTFRRTPIGGVFTVTVTAEMWNPLAAFYGYPPIFLNGKYFQLERKVNFARYRCAFLIRKETEKTGAMLVVRVDPAR